MDWDYGEKLLKIPEVNEPKHEELCPLSAAFLYGNYDLARHLIKDGVDLNTPDTHGWTPMYFAVQSQTPVHVIEEMFRAGALLKANTKTDKLNNVLLQLAIMAKNDPVAVWLLKHSFKPNFLTSFGISPLNLSIQQSCSSELMKNLLSHGAEEFGVGDPDPPAIHFALYNDINSLRNLIEAGVNVNSYYNPCKKHVFKQATHTARTTALHEATTNRQLEAVKLLVENGANVNAFAPDEYFTPLHLLALNPKRLNVKQKTVKEIALILLSEGADVNSNSMKHGTPLDVTLKEKNWIILEALIMNGFDVNKPMRSSGNMNIFRFVIDNKKRELVQLCIDFGADCAQCFQGKLPIYFGMKTNHSGIIELLLKHSYCLFNEDNLTLVKSYGISPHVKYLDFYHGVKTNNATKVRNALGMGASPGRSTLHYASSRRNPDVVRSLLEYGESPNSLDQKGYCPLQIAAKRGAMESCLILLRYGACYNSLTPEGHTPLALAEESKNKALIKVFKEISKNFSMVRKGNVVILRVLKKLLDGKSSKNRFFCYINCINRKGNTLMAEAFCHGFDRIGNEIMTLRG